MKIDIEREEDYRIRINGKPAGGITRYPDGWWAYTVDSTGNLYGQGVRRSKAAAVQCVKDWHAWQEAKP